MANGRPAAMFPAARKSRIASKSWHCPGTGLAGSWIIFGLPSGHSLTRAGCQRFLDSNRGKFTLFRVVVEKFG